MKIRLFARLAAAVAGAGLLAGCLVSETPLLDETNGRAAPFEPGRYEVCSKGGEDDADEADDCVFADITRDETGQYRILADEDDEAVLARFRRIERDVFLVQFRGEDDDDNFYLVGEPEGAGFVIGLIMCDEVSETFIDSYAKRGEIEVDTDFVTACAAKTLRAAEAVAKAWREATDPQQRSRMVFTPAPGN